MLLLLLAALLSISGLGRFTHEMRLAASQASVHPSGMTARERGRQGEKEGRAAPAWNCSWGISWPGGKYAASSASSDLIIF